MPDSNVFSLYLWTTESEQGCWLLISLAHHEHPAYYVSCVDAKEQSGIVQTSWFSHIKCFAHEKFSTTHL